MVTLLLWEWEYLQTGSHFIGKGLINKQSVKLEHAKAFTNMRGTYMNIYRAFHGNPDNLQDIVPWVRIRT